MNRSAIIFGLVVFVLLVGLLLALFFQKGTTEPFAETPHKEDRPMGQSHIVVQSPLVDEFYRRARSDLTPEGIGASTIEYLSGLSSGEQLKIAEALVEDPDVRLSSLGIKLLIELGYEDDAVQPLAHFVAAGGDLTAFVWGWMHSGDSAIADRMLGKLRRYFVDHLDEFGEEERKRINQLLREKGLKKSNPD